MQDLEDQGLGRLLGTGAAPQWAQDKLKGLYRGLCILSNMANDGEFAWQTFEAMQQDRIPVTPELANRLLTPIAANRDWQRALAVFQVSLLLPLPQLVGCQATRCCLRHMSSFRGGKNVDFEFHMDQCPGTGWGIVEVSQMALDPKPASLMKLCFFVWCR